MITVIIMSWLRPKQVRRILNTILPLDIVGQVIIWDNNPNGEDKGFQADHEKVTLIQSSRDMSLFTRFAAATLAKYDAILFHDDDTLIEKNTIEKLYEQWKQEPDRILGMFGRKGRGNGSYGGNAGTGDAPMIMTTIMMAHRKYASMALGYRNDPEIAGLMAEGQPYGNGEDLLISYLAMQQSGKPNRVQRLPYTMLTRQHAICHRWKGHWKYRTRLMKLLQRRFLVENSQPPAAG